MLLKTNIVDGGQKWIPKNKINNKIHWFWLNYLTDLSVNQSVSQSVSPSISQSVKSVSQSVSQSINQTIFMTMLKENIEEDIRRSLNYYYSLEVRWLNW